MLQGDKDPRVSQQGGHTHSVHKLHWEGRKKEPQGQSSPWVLRGHYSRWGAREGRVRAPGEMQT